MLDIPSPAASAFPGHWLYAALPQAQICQLQGAQLVQLATGIVIGISASLQRALHEAAADPRTLIVVRAGASWRLRRPPGNPPGFWLLQSLYDSRRLALQTFRTVLAAGLTDSLLHELRNPLNALGLQCDLLARTLKNPTGADAPAQAAARLTQMKERLRDLLGRQNSTLGLWLSAAGEEAPPAELATVVEETLRLLRSYASQREARLHGGDLSALGSVAPLGGIALRIVLMAVGLLAIESSLANKQTVADDGPQVVLQAMPDAGNAAAILEICAPFDSAALPAGLVFSGLDEFLATLALLLDGQPVELSHEQSKVAAGWKIRFRFLQRRR